MISTTKFLRISVPFLRRSRGVQSNLELCQLVVNSHHNLSSANNNNNNNSSSSKSLVSQAVDQSSSQSVGHSSQHWAFHLSSNFRALLSRLSSLRRAFCKLKIFHPLRIWSLRGLMTSDLKNSSSSQDSQISLVSHSSNLSKISSSSNLNRKPTWTHEARRRRCSARSTSRPLTENLASSSPTCPR